MQPVLVMNFCYSTFHHFCANEKSTHVEIFAHTVISGSSVNKVKNHSEKYIGTDKNQQLV